MITLTLAVVVETGDDVGRASARAVVGNEDFDVGSQMRQWAVDHPHQAVGAVQRWNNDGQSRCGGLSNHLERG